MSIGLELRKVKRTGFIAAFVIGGILAASIPILNTAVHSGVYGGLEGSSLQVLMDANWNMMSLLNVLLIVLGACILYHTEYADNAIQRMCTLPLTESRLFFGKFAVMIIFGVMVLVLEFIGLTFCCYQWYEPFKNMELELVKGLGYSIILMLPAVLGALLIASLCKNMWVSLGIGVVCVFAATILPSISFKLRLFPFALPFQPYTDATETTMAMFITAGITEIGILAAAELVALKARRALE